jgi:hypothetical protein
MAFAIDKCPVCNLQAKFRIFASADTAEEGYDGQCPRCGRVRVMQSVVGQFEQLGTQHLLSALFRRFAEAGTPPPLVTSSNVDELMAGLPVLRTVPEKMNGLLRILVNSKLPPGSPAPFNPNKDYPLIFSANGDEAIYLLGQLSGRGFVRWTSGSLGVEVTSHGYERAEALEASSYKLTHNAFVAMSFDKSRDFIFNEAIEPAIVDAGYRAIRIDRTDHINRIDDEIISLLRQSRFAVADFTGQRAGVYYEAGFMGGLGRNVFWMVEKKELDQVHFDVRQYNFIDYETAAEAKKRLYDRIMANEGKGPDFKDAT